MKKILIICFLMCSASLFALKTTFTSSIYTSQQSGTSAPQSIRIPSCPRKVHIINHTDSLPELEIALTAAEYIFSKAMQQEFIDLVDVDAELLIGDISDFGEDELCKVSVEYTDTIYDHCYYHNFSALGAIAPVLYPMAMSNQTRGESRGVGMHIYLNPTLPYHCDTTDAPIGKYDAITILLRALAIGCGLQSSIATENVQFGYTNNEQTYITAFDTQIYNDDNYTFADVVDEYVSPANFLNGHSVYAHGTDEYWSQIQVQLFNDWQMGGNNFTITSNTLNTIDPDTYTNEELLDDFYDLLDAQLRDGISLRSVTKYTMALLRKIGWEKTLPVGGDNPLEDIYNSQLVCNSNVLQKNTTYTIGLTPSSVVDIDEVVCKLNSIDSSYVIGTMQGTDHFSYSTIPQNIQWKRNPITKNIIGQFQAHVSMLVGSEWVTLPKNFDIEIPYQPNRPLIQRSENTINNNIQLNLKAFANGSNTYTVSYTGVANNDYHTFTVSSNALDTILTNIPATQLYNATIYGTNYKGKSDSCKFTFGFSAHPILNMTVFYSHGILMYDLSSNGTIDISDVVINSVVITDINGLPVLYPNAGSGDPIPVSSLPNGRYLLTVVADGNTYSRMFIKR